MWRADYDTDEIIQRSLREELGKDVTVLTVAHRLQSIMDADKIVSPNLILLHLYLTLTRYGCRWSSMLAGWYVARARPFAYSVVLICYLGRVCEPQRASQE